MATDGPQPQGRPCEEVLGRDEDQWSRVVNGAEQAPDQSHVMVERQPRNAQLREPSLGGHDGFQRRALGHEVKVSERHRPGLHRGARRELDERQ